MHGYRRQRQLQVAVYQMHGYRCQRLLLAAMYEVHGYRLFRCLCERRAVGEVYKRGNLRRMQSSRGTVPTINKAERSPEFLRDINSSTKVQWNSLIQGSLHS